MRKLYPFLFILLGLGTISNAQIIKVPGDQPTIQAGINNAADGDTVLITEGTYYENINFRGKAITVASHFILDSNNGHITKTIIDGSRSISQDTASAVLMCSGEDTTSLLVGFTIRGGKGILIRDIYYDWITRCGGGIAILNSGGKIIHNIIEENHLTPRPDTVSPFGCGLFVNVNNYHYAIIRNNIIRNNSGIAMRGWAAGIGILGGSILVEHNSITNNQLHSQYIAGGAGLYWDNPFNEGIIEEAIIRNNIISGNRIYSAIDDGLGAGVEMGGTFNHNKVQLYNNVLSDNQTEGYGGGIWCYRNSANIYNNIIFNNEGTLYGNNVVFEGIENEIILNNNLIWSGNVWIATCYGLVKVNSPKLPEIHFNKYTGIRNETFTRWFSLHPPTGGLYIGRESGMILFQTDSVLQNAFDPPVVLADFHCRYDSLSGAEATIHSQSTAVTGHLDLSHKENSLKFKFGVFNRTSSKDYQYLYQMKGIDTKRINAWDRSAIYRDIRPGKYTFEAAAIGNEDLWYPNTITLIIRIHPPWYWSRIAQVTYLLLLVLLIFVFIRYRTTKLRREKLVLEKEVAKRTREIREKNEQILEIERLKTKFFTDVSHEIRTPLSLITGPLEKLLKQEHPDPETINSLNTISRNSRRLLHLVNQLLDISRLDKGYMKLILEESNIMKHLRMLVSNYTSLAENRFIKYVVDIPKNEYITWYDQEKTDKIITNLLSNAFKFTQEKGTICCRVKTLKKDPDLPGMSLRIFVANTGQGIPIKDRKKIFERFYRVEEDLHKRTEGIGIGLSLTKELVDLMHGEVTLKCFKSMGTIFIVTIPLGKEHLKKKEYMLKTDTVEVKVEPAMEKTEQITDDEHISDQGIDILVVEDNEDLRTFLKENLSSLYNISEADGGGKGLDLAQSLIPDLIISDLMMPGMDGLELCENIKNDERTSHIPVILLTAKATTKDKIEGLKLGADDYIYKPFSIDEITVRIKNLLEQRIRLRKKYSNMIGVEWENLSVTTLDEKFLKKTIGIINDNLKDFDFDVSTLQDKMSISRVHLYRKLKALTGDSPSDLIRKIRLETAASFIRKGEENITEIAMNTGFSNPSYFTKSFRVYYGKTPREYKKELKNKKT